MKANKNLFVIIIYGTIFFIMFAVIFAGCQPIEGSLETVHKGALENSAGKPLVLVSGSGALTDSLAGSVNFSVTTAHIDDGIYAVTVAPLPPGVSIGNDGKVTIKDSKGTLTLEGDSSIVTSETNLTLTLNGITSPKFVLTILSRSVNFNGVTANGSSMMRTTQLTLNFSSAIAGLAATDITLTNGTGTVTKGALTGTGPTYTLAVTTTKAGTVSVDVSKDGYDISDNPQSVTVNYAIPVTLNSVTPNSTAGTTTSLTLAFSASITSLAAADITLTNSTGTVTKGSLSGSGPSYTLNVTTTKAGTVSVAVSKTGYEISGSPKSVTVAYPVAVTLNSVTANGSASETTTTLTLTFSQAISGLAPADITLSGVTGITKGTVSASGSTYTLGVSGFADTGTLSVSVAKTGYTISGSPKPVDIYYKYFTTGIGTSGSPFVINSAALLAKLGELVNNSATTAIYNNKWYRLSTNISLSAYGSGYNGGKGWIPIGTSSNPFKGYFDGNGKVISGLYINASSNSYMGLFGYLSDGFVNNVELVVDTFTVGSYSGSIAGYATGKSSILRCNARGAVNGSYGASYIGGLVGYYNSSDIHNEMFNCYFTGSVTGSGSVGGLVGYVTGSTRIDYCYSAATVESTGSYAGGIAGQYVMSGTSCGSIFKCFALGKSVKGSSNAGRIVGGSPDNLSDNSAWNGMTNNSGTTTWSNKGATSRDGADITGTAAKTQSTYTNLDWDFGTDQYHPWKFITGYPPVLYWQTTYPDTASVSHL